MKGMEYVDQLNLTFFAKNNEEEKAIAELEFEL